jgi:hypothetical protein
MSRRTLLLALTGIAVLVGMVLVAPAVSLALDEAAAPPSSAVPPLPSGVAVVRDDLRCGSGGCFHELRLTGPPEESPAELAASVGPPGETCRARSLLDRRRVCTGVDVLGNRVVLHVRYARSSVR